MIQEFLQGLAIGFSVVVFVACLTLLSCVIRAAFYGLLFLKILQKWSDSLDG